MKFSSVPQPLPKTEPLAITIDGQQIPCLIRQLMAEQEGEIMREALAFAEGNGAKNPGTDDPLYMLGMMVATIYLGFMDVDAPTELFFDGGLEQVRKCLDRENIAYLWAKQGDFQDRCSGRMAPLTDHEVIGWAFRIQADRDAALAELRPGRQKELLIGFANALIAIHNLMQTKEAAEALDETDGTTAKPPVAPRHKAKAKR